MAAAIVQSYLQHIVSNDKLVENLASCLDLVLEKEIHENICIHELFATFNDLVRIHYPDVVLLDVYNSLLYEWYYGNIINKLTVVMFVPSAVGTVYMDKTRCSQYLTLIRELCRLGVDVSVEDYYGLSCYDQVLTYHDIADLPVHLKEALHELEKIL